MTTIDTIETGREYSELIPALKAFYEAAQGEQLTIVMHDKKCFTDLKEFFAEQQIGFREIYDNDQYIIQFTKP